VIRTESEFTSEQARVRWRRAEYSRAIGEIEDFVLKIVSEEDGLPLPAGTVTGSTGSLAR
jgi:N-methylhydantoinase B/oxoprolinase/acetone carboxylase alpha subunit